MRIGLEAGTYTLDLAVELGIRGVPIDAGLLVARGVEQTLAPLTERGLSVCQIGAFGFNALNVDSEQRRTLEAVIPLAAATGCPYIVINPGNYHAAAFSKADARNTSDAALDEMARVLEPLLALAELYGAKLSIEAYLKGAISSAERFLSLWGRLRSDALRVNIDPTSLYDFRDLIDPMPLLEKLCADLAGHYGLVHIKEVALEDGFHIHAGLVPVGKGPTDWSAFLSLLAPHLPEDSWIIVEHVGSPEEGRASIDYLKQAASKAGLAW